MTIMLVLLTLKGYWHALRFTWAASRPIELWKSPKFKLTIYFLQISFSSVQLN